MLRKPILTLILILLVAVVAACAPAAQEPAASPTADVEPTPTDTAEQVAPEALPAARLALADYLNVVPDALELEKIEDMEWPNACLGLAGADEMCAEVITPGFLITFNVDGESYAVRADEAGQVVRVEAEYAEMSVEQPAAVDVATAALARELNLDAATIDVLSVETEEWSDSCLGLGGPAESCLAAITPGYRIILGANGQTYEVRTDETGDQVRIADEPVGMAPAPVDVATAALARQLGVEPATIEVRSVEAEEWPDSCLGLGGPAEGCLTVIVPGYRIILEANGQTYEVRTDQNGDQVRIADELAGGPATEPPQPEMNGAVVFFQRSGGLAGTIVTAHVYPDGTVDRYEGPPGADPPVFLAERDPAAVDQLLADLEAAGYFDLERSYLPADTCCDRFLYLVSAVDESGEQHTVEALEGTEENPEALRASLKIIEAFIEESFAE